MDSAEETKSSKCPEKRLMALDEASDVRNLGNRFRAEFNFDNSSHVAYHTGTQYALEHGLIRIGGILALGKLLFPSFFAFYYLALCRN